jgi:hypothetical protein
MSGPALVYPSPASDILNIEFDQEAIAQAKSPGQIGDKSAKQNVSYQVRLYSVYGNLLRQAQTQSEKIAMNVSALPNGMYYLHEEEIIPSGGCISNCRIASLRGQCPKQTGNIHEMDCFASLAMTAQQKKRQFEMHSIGK